MKIIYYLSNFILRLNLRINGPKIAKMFLRAYGGFPLHKGKSDLSAYKWALKKINSGEAIVIFPEGKRNPKGLGKPYLGAARIALKSGAPILPIAITGTENLISWTTVFKPRGTLNVKIGKIIQYEKSKNNQKTIQDEATNLTELIMSEIAKLLPLEYRGIYRSKN